MGIQKMHMTGYSVLPCTRPPPKKNYYKNINSVCLKIIFVIWIFNLSSARGEERPKGN